jgi:hypothetical protein
VYAVRRWSKRRYAAHDYIIPGVTTTLLVYIVGVSRSTLLVKNNAQVVLYAHQADCERRF